MKKITFYILFSLAFLGYGCGGAGQNAKAPAEGYGANESGLEDDNQTGAGQVDDSNRGADVSNNGGNMNNTASTSDSMQNVTDVNKSEAAKATEKTQQQVGNSQNRGEMNESKSRTTKNEVLKQ
jgi:hypothetical protein